METLICPQCGAQLDETHVTGGIVCCQYCNTQFRLHSASPPPPTPRFATYVAFESTPSAPAPRQRSFSSLIILVVLAAVGLPLYFALSRVNRAVSNTMDSVQQAINSAQSSANSIRSAANSMANSAQRRVNSNTATPSPTPSSRTRR
ncbi:MAG: hypothetical protein JO053_05875 [Acidobacteria bacterium]|nr:hypothetical protein [Acidobacteriota bacterium]